MGYLTFRAPDGNVILDGANVKSAKAQKDKSRGNCFVALEFDEVGKTKFADATKALVGQPISICLDDDVLFAPIVNDAIMDGKTAIMISDGLEVAERLADTIIAGALPFALDLVSVHSIRFYVSGGKTTGVNFPKFPF